MYIDKLTIHSNLKNYDVFIEESIEFMKDIAVLPNALYIVDENVWRLYRDSYIQMLPEQKTIVLPVREEIKNIKTVCDLYQKMMQFEARKNLNIVSIGGGITQDITGFLASTLYRGVNWIFIPTTSLAQVDSCIGAKTSLNFNNFKNLIGTFYPPSKVYIFPDFLSTLSIQDYYSGIGEMAKLHLMGGKSTLDDFINSLKKIDTIDLPTLVQRTMTCLEIKKSYIEKDEFDAGKRNMLNYGHCFGHAIESSTDFMVPHGQAIVLGMILANREALRRGVLSSEKEEFIRINILYKVLKVNFAQININIVKTVEAMGKDKKKQGNDLALVMLNNDFEMIKVTDLLQNDAAYLLKNLVEDLMQWHQLS